MSDGRAWNTKEIRDFKQAFGTRNSRSFFSSEPAHDPNAAFKRACEMLDKRRIDGTRTWMALADKHEEEEEEQLLRELAARGDVLTDDTNRLLADSQPASPDAATQTIIQTTDQWVAFEARCISVGNQMKKSGGDDKLRADLCEQAFQLLDLTAGLRNMADGKAPNPVLQQVEGDLLRMTAFAGDRGTLIADTLASIEALNGCRERLSTLTKVMAESASNADVLYQDAIKKMYGIEVKPSSVFGFPYANFLDTLAMVPPDHARNSAMTEIVGVFEKFSTGGSYEDFGRGETEGQKGGRLRINPVIDYDPIGKPFKDPESGETTRIDHWKSTTLHEIGHAVDAAYGLMKSHGGSAGCGGWQQQDPLVYMQPQRQAYLVALGRSGVTEAAFTSRIGGGDFDTFLIRVASGSSKPEELRELLEKYFTSVYDVDYYPTTPQNDFDDRLQTAGSAAQVLGITLGAVFPDGRGVMDVEDARLAFMRFGSTTKHLQTLTDRPAIVDPTEILDKVAALATDPASHAAAVAQWLDKTVANCTDRHEVEKAETKTRMVARWTDALLDSLPRPAKLEPYLADSKPWNTDLSGAMIGLNPASHEAYKGNTKWWRYAAGDRQSTYVSDYQWRAPGEWFAEIYAVSWYKKVEPPAGVAQVLRPYFYGGHLTPDQAV